MKKRDIEILQLKQQQHSQTLSKESAETSEMHTAISTLTTAKTELSSLVSNVGGQMNNVEQLTERYTNQQTFVQQSVDDIEKVDVSEALTTFSQQQATLQASMMIISQLNQVSLLDYIR